ncbi:hypothetical protein PYCCODRAFT_1472604 [Trametes coccinea BRFM310]|uniref:Uncharacterized protein n=1 Tax=Trametes coccinea (strain BRFM310) TaxID=1353009 RepID=A0A1Y2I758_TRAC3|nr:hypothetical protein PYCCODRAFT_1472604 [Trametes coccinea BRFM310]
MRITRIANVKALFVIVLGVAAVHALAHPHPALDDIAAAPAYDSRAVVERPGSELGWLS